MTDIPKVYFRILPNALHRCNEDVQMLHSVFPKLTHRFFPETKKCPTNTEQNQSQPGLDRSARPCCEPRLMPDWRCGSKEDSWVKVSRFYGSSSILDHLGKAKVPWPDMTSENLFLPQIGHPSRPCFFLQGRIALKKDTVRTGKRLNCL